MVNLAIGLRSNGHDIKLLNYYPKISFFRDEIISSGIKIHDVQKNSRFSFKVIFIIIKLIRNHNFDCIISFLDTPNIYCEIAKLLSFSKVFLIVCERSSRFYLKNRLFKLNHVFANQVVANSYDHGDWLKTFPHLKKKVKVIYNGYKFPNRFIPKSQIQTFNVRFLVIGRIDAGKNGINLIKALVDFIRKNSCSITVQWVGTETSDQNSISYRNQMIDLLTDHPLVSCSWEWLGHRKDIYKLLKQVDALIHISLYEGLPNAVCEAFVAGRPVIASNVCDHPRLVEDNIRGILCDPLSIDSISSAIERFVNLTPEERLKMGINARRYAEQHLSISRMVSEYEKLLNQT